MLNPFESLIELSRREGAMGVAKENTPQQKGKGGPPEGGGEA
jgi:hypothetical protein